MDDLTEIKGIGAVTAKKLKAAGIDSFAGLAALHPAKDNDDTIIAGATVEEINGWIEAAKAQAVESAAAEIDLSRTRVRVTAPAGPRRRAGLAFGPVARILTFGELGDDPQTTLAVLMDDPRLAVAPVIETQAE